MASSSTTISLHDDNLPRGGHATTQLTLLTVGLSSTSVNGHCTTIIASTARPVPFSTPSSTLFNSPPTGLTSTGTTSSSPMITRTDSYNGVMIFDHSLVQTQSLSRSTSQSSTLSHILRTPTSTSPQQRISIVLPTIPQSDHQEDEEEFANDVPPTRSPGASSLLEMDIQPKTPRHTVNLETSSLCQRNGEASSSFASSVPAVGRSYRQIKLDFLQESEVTLDDRHSTGEARLTALARGEHVHSTFRPEQHRSDDRQDAYENGGAAHESDSDTESSSWSEILTSDDRYHSVWVTEYNSQLRSRDERKRNDKMLQRKFKPQDGADAIVSTVSQRDQTSSSGVVKRMKHEREKAWDWLKANREVNRGLQK
ncbi:hypothetical protein I317_01759 [Kwoniella heveanensis CBS 569]|nr:hypothetical protein I317_01759 [Kwoniella heveanensis CBS 569]